MIEKHHAHLSPVIGHEERWLAADLEQAPTPAEVRRFLERIVKTLYTENAFTDATRAWFQRVSPRQHEDVWQNVLLAAAWMAAHLPQLRAGKPLLFPVGIDLGQFIWLLGQGQTPRNYKLLQRGQVLYLEEIVQTISATSLDAPGNLLANIQIQAPYISYRWIEEDNLSSTWQIQLLEQPISLNRDGRLRLRMGLKELTIDGIERPDWAEAIGLDEYGLYTDCRIQGVAQRLRWIVPGEFTMGSPVSEAERLDNETQHYVILTEGFWLADTACTQALWYEVMGDNPSRFKGKERPVEQVSWDDVQRFIERLNQLSPDGGFRLPTEAEWEYACRAGTTTPFWFGDQISPAQVNYDGTYPYAGGQKGKYREETVDVKALPCNSWGLYQMHGNVWEWCQDWYGAYPSATVTDPVGPAEGAERVLHGGSWFNDGGSARSAQRYRSDPAYRDGRIGFRLARGQAVRSASTVSESQPAMPDRRPRSGVGQALRDFWNRIKGL
ncbi:MAG: formylglycine-generating enzyme family protein [Candidatus Competibacteraceae bacterium]